MERAKYDPNYGLEPEQAQVIHHWHHVGAVLSIIIALGGVLLAMMIYLLNYWDPVWWVHNFKVFYSVLRNKYYMDDFYIKGIIQNALLPFNNILAFLDMGVYDRFFVDGWEKVNRILFTFSRLFDDYIIDMMAVDGVGLSVRAFIIS